MLRLVNRVPSTLLFAALLLGGVETAFSAKPKELEYYDHSLISGRNSLLLRTPDYVTRVAEWLEVPLADTDFSLSKGDWESVHVVEPGALHDILTLGFPVPALTYDQHLAVERDLMAILDQYFRPVFGKALGRVRFVVLDVQSPATAVYPAPEFQFSKFSTSQKTRLHKKALKENLATVITLDRSVLQEISTLDELIAVIGHEMFHYLRGKQIAEKGFDRVFKQMAEEELADLRSAHLLLKQGLNPIGMSLVLGKFCKNSPAPQRQDPRLSRREDEPWFARAGALQTHPPTEVRVTRVNAWIEKWADQQSFPELRPLPTSILAIQSTPLPNQRPVWYPIKRAVRAEWAAGYPFFFHTGKLANYVSLEPFGDFRDSQKAIHKVSDREMAFRYFESILPAVTEDLEYWSSQITPENVQEFARRHRLAVDRVVRTIAARFDDGFRGGFTTQTFEIQEKRFSPKLRGTGETDILRAYAREFAPFQKLFLATDQRLTNALSGLPGGFVSWDRYVLERINEFLLIKTRDELMAWLPRGVMNFCTYSVNLNPKLSRAVVEHYFRIAPLIRDVLDQGGWEYKIARKMHDLIGSFSRAASAAAIESGSPVRYLKELDSRIQRMRTLSAVEKTALFGSFKMGHRDGDALSQLQELLPQAQAFWGPRTERKDDFVRFHMDLTKAFRFNEENTNSESPVAQRKAILHFAERAHRFEPWLLEAMAYFDLGMRDAHLILESPYYWYSQRAMEAERSVERVERVNGELNASLKKRPGILELLEDGLLDGISGIYNWWSSRKRAAKNEERKAAFDAQLRKRILDRVGSTFYDRSEYKTDLEASQKKQVLLFVALKKSGEAPADLDAELELWTRFTHRGVTDFTDEWAEKILDRAVLETTSPRIEIVRALFQSQRIWDLRVRERMAKILYRPEHSELIRLALKSRDEPRKRLKLLMLMAKEIETYFPEESQEKMNILNFFANGVQTDREETSSFYAWAGSGTGSSETPFSDLRISDDQALGSRLIAQFFEELQAEPLATRLEVLDFFLGKMDQVPSYLDPHSRGVRDYSKAALANVVKVMGQYRARRLFQALEPRARAVMIDPLLVGERGILNQERGKDWVIGTLVPEGASWRALAVDLSEGYIEALNKFGQSHLKTLFVSYLVASSAKTSRGKYHDLLYGTNHTLIHEHTLSAEKQAGQVLRRLFEANAALTKLGQRVHSSHILADSINDEFASIKDQATPAGREEYFRWLQDSANCDDICRIVRLLDVKGSASVKVVMGAQVSGKDAVIHLVRPNAHRRGENSFELVDHALRYAAAKGHSSLRVVLPMLERARETFKREINLDEERRSLKKMSEIYSPDKTYGDGFKFTTPELIQSLDPFVKTHHVEAVGAMSVSKFSELPTADQSRVARAISEKEAELLLDAQRSGSVVFDKDRHEGNYLIVTDPVVCEKLGVKSGQLILAIDPGQMSEISSAGRESLLRGLALVAAILFDVGDRAAVVDSVRDWIVRDLVIDGAHLSPAQKAAIGEIVDLQLRSAQQQLKMNPGQVLATILAHVEEKDLRVPAPVWDYLTAFSTNQTWGRYLEQAGGGNPFNERALVRIQGLVECEDILKTAVHQ